MSLSQEQEESFDKIIDPETNMNVPVESAVGQQVIKNYLECLKNGPDSPNIVSTKIFYKPKKSKSISTSKSTSAKSTSTTSTNSRSTGSKLSTSKTVNNQSQKKGTLKGQCGLCGSNVYSTDQRVKHNNKYYLESCFKKTKYYKGS